MWVKFFQSIESGYFLAFLQDYSVIHDTTISQSTRS